MVLCSSARRRISRLLMVVLSSCSSAEVEVLDLDRDRVTDSNAQSLRGASNRSAIHYLSSSAACAPDFNNVRRS